MKVEIRRSGRKLPEALDMKYCSDKKDVQFQILGKLQFGVYEIHAESKTLIMPDGKTTKRCLLNHLAMIYPWSSEYIDIRWPKGFRISCGILITPQGERRPSFEITRVFPEAYWEL